MTLSQHSEPAFCCCDLKCQPEGLVTFILIFFFFLFLVFFFFVIYFIIHISFCFISILHMFNTFFTNACCFQIFYQFFILYSISMYSLTSASLLSQPAPPTLYSRIQFICWMEQLETASQIWRQHKLFRYLVFVCHCFWQLCVYVCVFVFRHGIFVFLLSDNLAAAMTIIHFFNSQPL